MVLLKIKLDSVLCFAPVYLAVPYQESVTGSVIQATRMVEFKYGLWMGNHLKVSNGLQRVRTIPGVVSRPVLLQGQTEFQSA